ncbi:MAG: TIGR04282 family arsenosugar biosynthesis glycosyltransferase [Nocardioidaceae bacterium]
MTAGVLVVAKLPVPGMAKTRLAADVGEETAADLAAAALLDTLAAVDRSGLPCVVACTGGLSEAARPDQIGSALDRHVVIRQRGDTFGDRLAAAHHDAAVVLDGEPVLQIGTDTPQLAAERLRLAADLLDHRPAVLGPASDGGWWALGVSTSAHAAGLTGVPMSRADTAAQTVDLLESQGLEVTRLPELTDVDTIEDAREVAAHPSCGRHFRAAMEAL